MARQVRERGMNAALASGEAGVGEIKPARSPLKVTQLLLALVVAVAGASAGFMTYRAVASSAVTFTGEVTPATTYNLDFPATGIVMTLTVHTGDHVKAGQILATQDSTVAAANVAAAQAAAKADAALVAADQAPQTPAATAAAQQLDVAKAQSAVSSAQAAIAVSRTKGQSLAATQQAVINGDQKLLDDDTARYAQSCTAASVGPTATPGSSGNSGAVPELLPAPPQSLPKPTASSTASPRRTPSHSASASASASVSAPPSPSASATGPSELCATLQTAVDRDNSGLAQANASLASIQASDLAEQQQDADNLAGSQAVLIDAQQLVASQGAAPAAALIAQAQAQLAAAQAQLSADQVALRQTSIMAPADGVVAETAGAVGDLAGSDGVHNYAGPAGQPGTLQNQQSNIQLFAPVGGSSGGTSQTPQFSALITLYSGSLNVTAQLPESQMTGIRIGQNASLEITAAGVTVPGRIYLITTVPTNVSGSTYYDVTFTMARAPAAVVVGMSVSVSLS